MYSHTMNCRLLLRVLQRSLCRTSRQMITDRPAKLPPNVRNRSNDADKFGSLDTEQCYKAFMEVEENKYVEKEEERPYIRLSTTQRAHNPSYYGEKIQKLAKEGKIREAISVFDHEMLEKDRVKPTPFVFVSLITALGRVGYTKKAFNLFNQMKKFGYTPPEATYTALFNACANSPYPEDGRSRATKLLQLLKFKGIEMNEIQYKAAIKALAVCGDNRKAVRLADEAQQRFPLDSQLLSALQMSCISDKKSGLAPALKLWRFMKESGCTPDIYNYNLLLRTLRDCSASARDLLQLGVNPNDSSAIPTSNETKGLESGNELLDFSSDSTQSQPDCLHKSPSLTSVASELSSKQEVTSAMDKVLCTPSGRLALVGGAAVLLNQMQADGVVPDVISLSMLLELAPNTADVELFIVDTADRLEVKLDTNFFNAIIRRRVLRKEDSVKEILEMIGRRGFFPDIRTFGELASGCRSRAQGRQLLKDMKNLGVEPSEVVLSILLRRSGFNFSYKRELCTLLESLKLEPSLLTLRNLQHDVDRADRWIADQRQKDPKADLNRLTRELSIFKKFYKPWLKRTNVKLPQHPWKDFRNIEQ